MTYKQRPGIIMIRICDVDILVATRSVWADCPKVRPIPRFWAFCWMLMNNNRTSDDAIQRYVKLFHKSESETRNKLNVILEELYSEGYLICEEV